MSDIGVWFRSLPIFTRSWLSLTFAFTLLGRFGILRAYQLTLSYDHIVKYFQIWRPFTALFFYPLSPVTGFHFIINCYFLYMYSIRLETGQFFGRPADYLFLLVFNWLVCVVIGLLVQISVLMDPMVLSILYIWCQLNRDVVISFWFGSRFKAMYLPWVLLAFNSIVMGGGVMELCGIIVGHIYFFLMFKYPQEFGGPQLLSTPQIFYDWFPSVRSSNEGFGRPPDGSPRGYNWGQGHVLGAQ
ncbi:derlin-1 [Cimex lectularius]|uniref:Derlin n=1 Tax=Cimex lectularius TaxID=79782 RepID=A0A8I6SFU5_CIMLE|nr:derlin-1 [Cimex lectularius]